MTRDKWYLALIITSLIVLVSLAGGCMLTVSPQGTASPPAAITYTDNTSISPPEATTTSPITVTATPSNGTQAGSDPVSGRNEEIDISWEQFCLSSEYQVQIAKDPGFTIIVLDTGAFSPTSAESPAAYYPAGGQVPSSSSAIGGWGNLEAGHTYYWRVRVLRAATGQHILSPWSEVKSFTLGSGLPASNPSYGLQPLYPNNGCGSYPVKPVSFSWSPLKDTTKYRFILAKDAAMNQVVTEAEVTTTAYEYDGELEYGESYFWRVMALEPAPSDWSASFSFQTETPPPQAPPALQPETPLWAWVVIAIGLALLIGIIVFIFRVHRR